MKKQTLFEKQCETVLSTITATNLEDATPLKTIINRTGYTRRMVTDCIHKLREEHPICATKVAPGGYWIGDKSDLIRLERTLRAEANTTYNTAENIKRQINKL